MRRMLLSCAVIAVLVTGCGGNTENPPPASTPPSPTPSPQAPTPTEPGTPGVSEQAAQNLCDAIEAELSNWRVQGPTLGKPGLNLLVQQWAAQNGNLNIYVLRDRTIVDDATKSACPDVRQQAIDALEIPDLASGLVGI
ncbi:MAG TPA: hypothetical protein VIW24_27135 [Aldersonia sp.]